MVSGKTPSERAGRVLEERRVDLVAQALPGLDVLVRALGLAGRAPCKAIPGAKGPARLSRCCCSEILRGISDVCRCLRLAAST